MKWLDYIRQGDNWKPIYVLVVPGGRRIVRTIEDIKFPQEWEVDKTVRPVVD